MLLKLPGSSGKLFGQDLDQFRRGCAHRLGRMMHGDELPGDSGFDNPIRFERSVDKLPVHGNAGEHREPPSARDEVSNRGKRVELKLRRYRDLLRCEMSVELDAQAVTAGGKDKFDLRKIVHRDRNRYGQGRVARTDDNHLFVEERVREEADLVGWLVDDRKVERAGVRPFDECTSGSLGTRSGIVARRSSCPEVSHVAPPERSPSPAHGG
jgi:hypothetical protein